MGSDNSESECDEKNEKKEKKKKTKNEKVEELVMANYQNIGFKNEELGITVEPNQIKLNGKGKRNTQIDIRNRKIGGIALYALFSQIGFPKKTKKSTSRAMVKCSDVQLAIWICSNWTGIQTFSDWFFDGCGIEYLLGYYELSKSGDGTLVHIDG